MDFQRLSIFAKPLAMTPLDIYMLDDRHLCT